VRTALQSEWGRLFANWENTRPGRNGAGYPDVGLEDTRITTAGMRHFLRGLRLVGMAVKESPEFGASFRRTFGK